MIENDYFDVMKNIRKSEHIPSRIRLPIFQAILVLWCRLKDDVVLFLSFPPNYVETISHRLVEGRLLGTQFL